MVKATLNSFNQTEFKESNTINNVEILGLWNLMEKIKIVPTYESVSYIHAT